MKTSSAPNASSRNRSLTIVTGSIYLGNYLGDAKPHAKWLAEKVDGWTDEIRTLEQVKNKKFTRECKGSSNGIGTFCNAPLMDLSNTSRQPRRISMRTLY